MKLLIMVGFVLVCALGHLCLSETFPKTAEAKGDWSWGGTMTSQTVATFGAPMGSGEPSCPSRIQILDPHDGETVSCMSTLWTAPEGHSIVMVGRLYIDINLETQMAETWTCPEDCSSVGCCLERTPFGLTRRTRTL